MHIFDKIKMRESANQFSPSSWRGSNKERGLLNDKQFLMGSAQRRLEAIAVETEKEKQRIEDNTITHVKYFSKFVKFRHKQIKYKISNKKIQENSYLGRATAINEEAVLKFKEYWEEVK